MTDQDREGMHFVSGQVAMMGGQRGSRTVFVRGGSEKEVFEIAKELDAQWCGAYRMGKLDTHSLDPNAIVIELDEMPEGFDEEDAEAWAYRGSTTQERTKWEAYAAQYKRGIEEGLRQAGGEHEAPPPPYDRGDER